MVVAVPPDRLAELRDRCDRHGVELADLGAFTGDGRLVVRHAGAVVLDLDTAFLHDGRPQRRMMAAEPPRPTARPAEPHASTDPAATLLALLAHRNIASKAATIHRYDHEIGGGTVVRPLVGVAGDGPADGVVLADPRDTHGIAIGIGVNPWYGAARPRGDGRTSPSTRRSATSSPSAPTPTASPCSTTSRGAIPRRPSTLGELVAAVARLLRRRRRPRRAVRVRQGLAEQRVHRRRRPPPRRAADARDHRRRPRARRRRAASPPSSTRPATSLVLLGDTAAEFAGSHLDLVHGAPVDAGAGAAARPRRARPATAACTPAIRGRARAVVPRRQRGRARRRPRRDVHRRPPRRSTVDALPHADAVDRAVRRVGRPPRRRGRGPTMSTPSSPTVGPAHRPRHGHRRRRRSRCPASRPLAVDELGRRPFTPGGTRREPADRARRRRAGHQPRHRRRCSPSTSPAPSRRSCSPPSWPRAPSCSTTPASSSSPAGSATATPSAPAGCSPSTSRRPPAGASASALRRVRRRRPPGHRHLQRLPGAHPRRPAAGRARPQRRRPLRLPLGRAGRRAGQPLHLDRRPRRRRPLPDRPRRGPLRAPRSRRRSPPPGRWPCATPAATPTARSPTSPACATRPASCSA